MTHGETNALLYVRKSVTKEAPHLTYPAIMIPKRRKPLLPNWDMSRASRESTTLKSVVKRLRILPKGTVSIHLNGVLKIVKLNLSKSFREARSDPVNMNQYLKVPRMACRIERPT